MTRINPSSKKPLNNKSLQEKKGPVYVVQSGDNLSTIGQKTGRDWTEIAKLNGLKEPYRLQIGQELKLPPRKKRDSKGSRSSDKPGIVYYKIKPDDTLSEIAQLYEDVTWEDIVEANPGLDPKKLPIGKEIIIPEGGYRVYHGSTYVVRHGDSIASIAEHTASRYLDLKKLNRMVEDNLQVGQVLLIPMENWNGLVPKITPFSADFRVIQEETSRGKTKTRFYLGGKKISLGTHISENKISFIGDIRPDTNQWNQLTPGEKAVCAVSMNEGAFNAVQTWDRAYLSCGIFQWNRDDLRQLLLHFKENNSPEAFNHLFGDFGLDVDGKNIFYLDTPLSELGYETLREYWWAFVFSRAGEDPAFQRAQFEFGQKRLDHALSSGNVEWLKDPLCQALLLDVHVLRPKSYFAFLRTAKSGLAQSLAFSEYLEKRNLAVLFSEAELLAAIFCARRIDVGLQKDQQRIDTICGQFGSRGQKLSNLISYYQDYQEENKN